jgi:hypothetical protein
MGTVAKWRSGEVKNKGKPFGAPDGVNICGAYCAGQLWCLPHRRGALSYGNYLAVGAGWSGPV